MLIVIQIGNSGMFLIGKLGKPTFIGSASIIFMALICASITRANDDVQNVFAAFEFICLEQIRNPSQRPKLLGYLGAIELPTQQADMFLAPQKGRAWMVTSTNDHTNEFVVSLTDTTVCTVSAPKTDGASTLKLFESHTRNKKISEEKRGSQSERAYAVSHDDQFHDGDAHALVMITTSPLFNGEGIILSALPEALLAREGKSALDWPK